LHQFRASVKKKDVFKRCVSTKKTVSLFQSHVSKHEFFLLESCQVPVASEFFLDSLSYNLLSMGGVTLIP